MPDILPFSVFPSPTNPASTLPIAQMSFLPHPHSSHCPQILSALPSNLSRIQPFLIPPLLPRSSPHCLWRTSSLVSLLLLLTSCDLFSTAQGDSEVGHITFLLGIFQRLPSHSESKCSSSADSCPCLPLAAFSLLLLLLQSHGLSCSLDKPEMLLPQGLCNYCSLCLASPPCSRNPQISLLYLLRVCSNATVREA